MVEVILSHEKVLNIVAKKGVFIGGEAHSVSGFLLLPIMRRDFLFQKSWICVHFLTLRAPTDRHSSHVKLTVLCLHNHFMGTQRSCWTTEVAVTISLSQRLGFVV